MRNRADALWRVGVVLGLAVAVALTPGASMPPTQDATDGLEEFDPVRGSVRGRTAPPEKASPGSYEKERLPFKEGKYPGLVHTPETWMFGPVAHQGYLNPEDHLPMLNEKTKLSLEHVKLSRVHCLQCHGNPDTVPHGAYQLWLTSAHSKARRDVYEKYIQEARLLGEGRIDEFFESAGIPRWFVEMVPGIRTVAGLYRQAVIEPLGVEPGTLAGTSSPIYDRATDTYKISCIDCHRAPGAEVTPDAGVGIVLPTTRTCAVCHARQWVEYMSELTVNAPPNPPGRPSHAAGSIALMAPAWYAANSRAQQIGCDMCHATDGRGCDSCHTRHSFDPAIARHPKACETCHKGPTHPDWESWSGSKHGCLFEARPPDLKKRLVESLQGRDYPGPTCQYCHMKYREDTAVYISHNMVVKAIYRSGGYFKDPSGKYMGDPSKPYSPRVALEKAKELGETPIGFTERRKQWLAVCSECHATRFASTYFDVADEVMEQTFAQLIVQQQQVQNAKDDRLLLADRLGVRGRDALQDYQDVHWTLEPSGGLWRWFDRDPYTGSEIERRFVESWYRWTQSTYRGMMHGSPDMQFHTGVARLWKEMQYIDEEELKLRILKALEEKTGLRKEEIKPFHK
ncbi:MAG: hypothetical protein HYY16_10235 [Planctomycetes bacterium]|nr:hypothetical protein [Planctomycetota bacterium]